MDTVTSRQYIALHLYYIEGQSYRKIGVVLGIDGKTAYRLVMRGRRNLIEYRIAMGGHTSPLVDGLLAPSPTASITRNVGHAASRREELLDALERRMAQRDADEADIRECMAGDSFSPTHAKRNSYDQWETRYLMSHEHNEGEGLPTSAYDARRAAESCACDDMGCPLGCERCWHEIRE